MKLKGNFILNSANNQLVIFDIIDDRYYEFNNTAAYIFNNISLDVNLVIKGVSENHDVGIESIKSDVTSMYNHIRKGFFENENPTN